ncbi:hypothetical protein GCM10023148_18290 [Actinokineospora soli]
MPQSAVTGSEPPSYRTYGRSLTFTSPGPATAGTPVTVVARATQTTRSGLRDEFFIDITVSRDM